MKRTHNKAFGTDFETSTGNSGSLWKNCHCLHLGEAAQKIVMLHKVQFNNIACKNNSRKLM